MADTGHATSDCCSGADRIRAAGSSRSSRGAGLVVQVELGEDLLPRVRGGSEVLAVDDFNA